MTVSYIDPPGPLANTREPLDFTTTELVTSISIEYSPAAGNGLRETVFDGTEDDGTGGDFAWAYRNSTRTGTGPYTWHIVRDAAWPADLRLRVKEAAGGGPAGWKLLYDVDFTALSNQTLTPGGSYALDGLTWWCKPGGVSQSNVPAIVAGSGLRMGTSSAAEYIANFRSPKMFLPFANVPGFDATAPVVVQANLTGQLATYNVLLGVVDAAADATTLSAGELARRAAISAYTDGGTGTPHGTYLLWSTDAVGTTVTMGSTPSREDINRGYALYVLNEHDTTACVFDWTQPSHNPYSGGVDLTANSAGPTVRCAARTLESLGVYFAYGNSTGLSSPGYARRLKIWQPGN